MFPSLGNHEGLTPEMALCRNLVELAMYKHATLSLLVMPRSYLLSTLHA